MIKRLINKRPLFNLFVGIVLGIFIAGLFICGQMLSAIIISLLCIFSYIFLLVLFKIKYRQNIISQLLMFALIATLGASLLFCNLGYKLNKLDNFEDFALVEGRICEVEQRENYQKLVIEKVLINEKEIVNAKIMIAAYDYHTSFNIGDYISFSASLRKNDYLTYGRFNNELFINEIYSHISISSFELTKGEQTIFEQIRENTKDKISSFVDKENVGVFEALLLGDKTNLSDELYSAYAKSGISHILSISGLHVGFIVLLLLFILKLFKVNNKVRFIITTFCLIIYCCLCGFCSSVLRASLMSVCLMLSLVVGERYDGMSAIGLAGIILLVINPFNLYDLGFELSFGAVFGILFFYKTFKIIFDRLKLPNFISSAFSITVSAQVLTLPIISNAFGFIAPIGLIANFIILPLFSVFFCGLFIVFISNMVFPLGFIFTAFNFLLNIFNTMALVFAKADVIVLMRFDYVSMFIYFVSMFLLSKYLLLKGNTKLAIMLCAVFAISPILKISNSEKEYKQDQIITFESLNDINVITTRENEKYLIYFADGKDYETRSLNEYLFDLKIFHFDKIIIPNYTGAMQNEIIKLCDKYYPNNLVIPLSTPNADVAELNNNLKDNKIIFLDSFNDYEISQNFSLSIFKVNGAIKIIDVIFNRGDIQKQTLLTVGTLTSLQVLELTNNIENKNLNVVFNKLRQAELELFEQFNFEKVIAKDVMLYSKQERYAIASIACVLNPYQVNYLCF